MSQSQFVLEKLARNAKQRGLTVSSQSATAVVIDNGSNDLTISYVDASFAPSMVGGVDGATSPFLGAGFNAPGKILIKSAISTGDDMTDIIDSSVAATVLAMCACLANDLRLENSDASFSADIRGTADWTIVGQ